MLPEYFIARKGSVCDMSIYVSTPLPSRLQVRLDSARSSDNHIGGLCMTNDHALPPPYK